MTSEETTTTVPNPTEHNQWYPFANRPLPPEMEGQAVNPAVIPVFDAAPLPRSARFVVVGAGVHGLSSAYHLAMYLQRTGKGTGRDVVLIDKQGPGAGATGLACGCIRNMYMTGPLHAILRASVEVWESDPVNLGFQQVGYVSVGESNQIEDYYKLQASQAASGYPSDVYTGSEARAFLTNLWPDFKTDNCDVVLHEHRSGYAGTHMAVWGLDQKCRQWGVQRVYGATVTGYSLDTSGSVTAVETDQGSIACEQVVVGAGAWTPQHWEWLGGPSHLDVLYPRRPYHRADGHVDLLAAARGRGRAARGRRLPHRPAPRLAGAARGAHEHAGVLRRRQVPQGPLLLLCALRRGAGGRARPAGRDHPGQDRAESGGRALRPPERRVPGRGVVRRLLLRHPGHAVQAPGEPAAVFQGAPATAGSARSPQTTCRCSTTWPTTPG